VVTGTLATEGAAMREVVVGKIDCWDCRGGFAFARSADGVRFFLPAAELAKAGVQRLDIGDRVQFETRLAVGRRAPWGTNIEVRR
jgi:cold shock CspA family protein